MQPFSAMPVTRAASPFRSLQLLAHFFSMAAIPSTWLRHGSTFGPVGIIFGCDQEEVFAQGRNAKSEHPFRSTT